VAYGCVALLLNVANARSRLNTMLAKAQQAKAVP
jgi:hypothetical protein